MRRSIVVYDDDERMISDHAFFVGVIGPSVKVQDQAAGTDDTWCDGWYATANYLDLWACDKPEYAELIEEVGGLMRNVDFQRLFDSKAAEVRVVIWLNCIEVHAGYRMLKVDRP